jgi:cell division protein FtsL
MTLEWSPDIRSRNYRIPRSADARNLTNTLASVLCVLLVAGAFVFYLWTRSQMRNLGYEEQNLQGIEETLARMRTGLIVEEEMLTRPQRIDFIATKLLDMEPLGPYQRIAVQFDELGMDRPGAMVLAKVSRTGEPQRRAAGQNANNN